MIFCDDESRKRPLHKGRLVHVATCVRWQDEDDPWSIVVVRGIGAKAEASEVRSSPLWITTDGAAIERDPWEDPKGSGHYKYELPCNLCQMNVQTTHPRIAPVLETLHRAGVNRISLAALAATLREK